jgi:hypothetical protein
MRRLPVSLNSKTLNGGRRRWTTQGADAANKPHKGEDHMKLTTVKLVTVIADRRLKGELIRFFTDAGITGYTFYPAYGKGPFLIEDETAEESENIQFKILVSPLLSLSLMKAVGDKEFFNGEVIVFEQDAAVLRPEKFGGGPSD